LDYAAATNIPVTSSKAKPYSMDANLAHCSYEAGMLEDPNQTPPDDMWTMTQDPIKAPNEPEDVTVEFEKGLPVKVVTKEKTLTDSVELFKELNRLGFNHGVGRIDIVENRFIGLKVRDIYLEPSLTCMFGLGLHRN
jgi:argininosuccinate synthase